MAGVSIVFIADMEYGNKSLTIKTLFRLRQAFERYRRLYISGNIYAADGKEKAAPLRDETA